MKDFKELSYQFNHECNRLSIPITDAWMICSLSDQMLYLSRKSGERFSWRCSTSLKPASCVENSFGTPTGMHLIAEKIGQGQPEGMIFKARVATGLTYHQITPEEAGYQKNLITTRILRLRGIEEGLNAGSGCDSFERYIYIHGTNREEEIGKRISSGCILLKNREVVELFDAVEINTLLWIS